MRWILCGKNDAAVAILEDLVQRGDEVWAIGVRGDDGRDGWQRSLRAAAQRLGVPFDQPSRINAPNFVTRLHEFGARALISIQYDQILKGELFRSLECPCLNLHFALMPRHRGVSPIAWAVAQGDEETGVTLHHMVEEIDAADVIARRAVPIAPDASAREVYDRVSEATFQLFRESYPFPDELLARHLVQDPSQASYHRSGEFDFSQRRIDWNRPVTTVHRWVRALIFPPLQHPETRLGDRTLEVTRLAADVGASSAAPPGSVLEASQEGVRVATGNGSLRILGMRDSAAPRLPDAEVMASLAPGDRFS